MRPPSITASRRQIDSPSPAPPYSREADESAWKKVSNTFDCSSLGIPMPLSSTWIWK